MLIEGILMLWGFIQIIAGATFGLSFAGRIPTHSNHKRGLLIAFSGFIPLVTGILIGR